MFLFEISFSDKSIAIFFVCLKLLSMIIKTTIIGTLKNIPEIPQIFPMIDKKIKKNYWAYIKGLYPLIYFPENFQ